MKSEDSETDTKRVIKSTKKELDKKDKALSPICKGLHKEGQGKFFHFPETYKYQQFNCFIWDDKEKEWVVSGVDFMKNIKTGGDLYIMANFATKI